MTTKVLVGGQWVEEGGGGGADPAATMGVVVHGADATVARPAGYLRVWWYGSVAPNNAGDYDHYTYEAPPS